MPGHPWHYGPHWGYYHSEVEIDREKVTEATKALLAKATTGDAWTDPHGGRHIPLLVDHEIVGNLWDDAALTSLEVAAYWAAPFGVKAELSHNGRIVGMVWVNV
ncbi:MAG: hypothetical protein M0029_10350 [Actinomycetota bacterium]|jgi:hypothetical protein|nr:hypothetical protein [Actinomycetota bacterium]